MAATNLPYTQYSLRDKASGSLSAELTSGATSCTLTSGQGARFPSADFCVRIDDEVIYVGSRSTDTLSSLTRGYNGTTAATHAAGTVVYQSADAALFQRLYDNLAQHTHDKSGIADFAHTHPQGDITNLVSDLAGKAAASHTHGTADIDNDAVTFAKIQNITTARLLGRNTAGAGDIEEITLGTNLSFSGTTLNAASGGGGTPTQYNQSSAAQGPGFVTDTYLTGSMIAIPANALKVGSRYHLVFDVSKTAAGTAAPVITVRVGTNGTTADTARLTFTFLAQTAAADIGTFELWLTFRVVGASAVLQGTAQCRHRLSVTGLQNLVCTTLQVTSGAFDSSVANSKIGVSVLGGTSAAWTVQNVQAELLNLT